MARLTADEPIAMMMVSQSCMEAIERLANASIRPTKQYEQAQVSHDKMTVLRFVKEGRERAGLRRSPIREVPT